LYLYKSEKDHIKRQNGIIVAGRVHEILALFSTAAAAVGQEYQLIFVYIEQLINASY